MSKNGVEACRIAADASYVRVACLKKTLKETKIVGMKTHLPMNGLVSSEAPGNRDHSLCTLYLIPGRLVRMPFMEVTKRRTRPISRLLAFVQTCSVACSLRVITTMYLHTLPFERERVQSGLAFTFLTFSTRRGCLTRSVPSIFCVSFHQALVSTLRFLQHMPPSAS